MQGLEELDAGRRVRLEWPGAATPSSSVIEIAVLDAIRPRRRRHGAHRRHCGCSAAMLVPRGREAEWVFSSEGGQWQLLASAGVSRLILLSRREGEIQESVDDEVLKAALFPLATALAPRACFAYGPPALPFLSYDDGVAWRRVVDRAVSPLTGPMLVEDVRLEKDTSVRRRLVFKKAPNLIQSEVSLHGEGGRVKHDELVHVYLAPLVAGLNLVAGGLARWTAPGRRAEVICIGTGGGALPMFLSRQLDELVHVQAVDLDEVVVGLGKKHFGLGESNNLEVRVEDGLATVARLAQRVQEQRKQADGFSDSAKETSKLEADGLAEVQVQKQVRDGVPDARVHVIIVDVTSADARDELSSPLSAFVGTEFLAAARTALHEDGMLAMNVMPSTAGVHEAVLDLLASVFQQVYQIQVSSGDNFAVFALPTGRVMEEPAKEDEAEAEGNRAALRRRRWQVNSVVDIRLVAQISRVRG